jgi:hypothetical protein
MRTLWLICLLIGVPAVAGAFTYNEGIDGELSADRLAPTALVAAVGSNTLTGSTVSGDLDYVRITLPVGLQLGALVLDSVASTDDVAFIALQAGPIFTVTPATATQSALLGYTHFGTGPTAGGATPGNDFLDDMCVAPGAIHCVPPLTGSDYTFWIQQTGAQPFAYSFDFVVTPVPEPSTFALLGLGAAGLAVRKRSRR